MKKMLTLLLVVVALVAVASNASAITCTIDQRPAATLLVPYFQVSIGSTGVVPADTTYRDTIVTIGNASTAPVLAHVSIWNHRSVLALDFMVALSPNDIQSMLMSGILTGSLPITPDALILDPSVFPNGDGDACQRNALADEYPLADGYLRFRPTVTGGPIDNSAATTQYGSPAFQANSSFALRIYDILDADSSDDCDQDAPDGTNTGLLTGYITIDMANYCSLSNPDNSTYWTADAAGWENDLWGDYILKSGSGLPTYGNPTVNLEAEPGLPCGTSVGSLNGCVYTATLTTPVVRTFYARYWEDPDAGNTGAGINTSGDTGLTTVNGDENCYLAPIAVGCPGLYPFLVDSTFGDMREPIGGNWAGRYVTTEGITSYLRVWRAGGGLLKDLTGASCTAEEANPGLVLYDEHENTTSTGGCPSPCTQPTVNFPFETQRDNVANVFTSFPGDGDGWININFINAGDANSTNLDQAWLGYDFETGAAFLNAGIEGTQLDQSSCDPVNPVNQGSTLPNPAVVLAIAPVVPQF
jgi:hypothetical protein